MNRACRALVVTAAVALATAATRCGRAEVEAPKPRPRPVAAIELQVIDPVGRLQIHRHRNLEGRGL